jgi:hypothetical protein
VAHVRNAIALSLVVEASAPTAAAAAQPADLARAAAEPLMKQLEAFRRDDYEAAYVFASTEIEQMLDHLAFERMVKGGLPRDRPLVLRARRPDRRGAGWPRVRPGPVKGANGAGIDALYEVVREHDGWKINSVVTRPDPGLVLAPLPRRERAA